MLYIYLQTLPCFPLVSVTLALIGGNEDSVNADSQAIPIVGLDISAEESHSHPLPISPDVDYALSVTIHHENSPQKVHEFPWQMPNQP